jgi:hypothetical protein
MSYWLPLHSQHVTHNVGMNYPLIKQSREILREEPSGAMYSW